MGDYLGKPTPFALGFASRGLARRRGPGRGIHLPAIYDLVSVSTLVLVLHWLRRRPRCIGLLILSFATQHGTGRVVEDFRVDVTHGTGLTGSQWASAAWIVAVGV